MRSRFTRRSFLVGISSVGLAAAGGITYTRFAEPHWLDVSRWRVAVAQPAGSVRVVRIVHLSDFHASRVVSLSYIDEAVSLALAQQPDAIALTGDFFTNRLSEPERFAAILRRMSAAAPTYAVLGNHDGGPWTRAAGGNATIDEAQALLKAANIPCLLNDARDVVLGGRTFQFIGVGDLWSRMCDPDKAFQRAAPRDQSVRVVLNHNPDAKDLFRSFDWQLMLCGHTHGGQLRLPLLGTPFAPVVDKRYVQGLHRWADRWLYITRGVGNLHGLRFNCRPEVSVLEVM